MQRGPRCSPDRGSHLQPPQTRGPSCVFRQAGVRVTAQGGALWAGPEGAGPPPPTRNPTAGPQPSPPGPGSFGDARRACAPERGCAAFR